MDRSFEFRENQTFVYYFVEFCFLRHKNITKLTTLRTISRAKIDVMSSACLLQLITHEIRTIFTPKAHTSSPPLMIFAFYFLRS